MSYDASVCKRGCERPRERVRPYAVHKSGWPDGEACWTPQLRYEPAKCRTQCNTGPGQRCASPGRRGRSMCGCRPCSPYAQRLREAERKQGLVGVLLHVEYDLSAETSGGVDELPAAQNGRCAFVASSRPPGNLGALKHPCTPVPPVDHNEMYPSMTLRLWL